MYEVQMPKFGATMKTGEINEWLVKVGDRVEKGTPLCEISTDKITNVLESFTAGELVEIRVEEGDEAAIGDVIACIKED